MKIIDRVFDSVLLLQTPVFPDDRGCFFESCNNAVFNSLIGEEINFVQDNCSISKKNVVRGMHYQVVKPQGKLIRVMRGSIFDVFVDMRSNSPTLGRWAGFDLSVSNGHALWIPEGFAHGFLATSDDATVLYKVNEFWHKEHDRSMKWNDADVAIKWPVEHDLCIVSSKDNDGKSFKESEKF